MDTPTAAPDEKTLALATQLNKETSNPSGQQLEISADRFQLFGCPVDLKFDRRTSGVSFRTPKNARIPDV